MIGKQVRFRIVEQHSELTGKPLKAIEKKGTIEDKVTCATLMGTPQGSAIIVIDHYVIIDNDRVVYSVPCNQIIELYEKL